MYALALDASGSLYAGGGFTTAGDVTANYIAQWDGTSWSALGSGMSGGNPYAHVKSLAIDDSGALYAGGDFTTAGGVTVNNIAKWDGSAWSALGTGTAGGVCALTVDKTGMTPILLFDDIFDKLDPERVRLLIGMVCHEPFGQVFITDTHKMRMEDIIGHEAQIQLFEVKDGGIL